MGELSKRPCFNKQKATGKTLEVNFKPPIEYTHIYMFVGTHVSHTHKKRIKAYICQKLDYEVIEHVDTAVP